MEITCDCGLQVTYNGPTFHAISEEARALCKEPEVEDRSPGHCRWFQEQVRKLTGRTPSQPRNAG